jgi:hypothetical protein
VSAIHAYINVSHVINHLSGHASNRALMRMQRCAHAHVATRAPGTPVIDSCHESKIVTYFRNGSRHLKNSWRNRTRSRMSMSKCTCKRRILSHTLYYRRPRHLRNSVSYVVIHSALFDLTARQKAPRGTCRSPSHSYPRCLLASLRPGCCSRNPMMRMPSP